MTDQRSINAGTPTVTVTDNRGQPVCTLQFCRSAVGETAELRISRTTYSAAGIALTEADPRLGAAGVCNVSLVPSLGGAPLHRSGVDDGDTWSFADILGRPLWQRDSAATVTTYTHDALGRPVTVSRVDAANDAQPIVRERHYYGDTAPAFALPGQRVKTANLAGQPVFTWDSAGQQRTGAVSLGGVPLSTTRCLLLTGDREADWCGDDGQGSTWQEWEGLLDGREYTTQFTVNALGQPLVHTNASGHCRRQAYDVGGRLAGQWLTLKGQTEQAIVLTQTYTAGGLPLQQTQGNGVTVSHDYDALSGRLNGTSVARLHDGKTQLLQALTYSYDPVGNLLTSADTAQATRWFRNQQVSPVNTYTYDSLYQLQSATGRENANQKQPNTTLPVPLIPLPSDSSQYTQYTRTFSYDRGGNLIEIRHSAPKTANQWTSTLVVAPHSNHAANSSVFTNVSANTVETLFDCRGNQAQLQPGQTLSWDAHNRLHQVHDSSGTLREYYGYAGAQRVLKVTELAKETRTVVYLDGLEIRTTQQGTVSKEALEVSCLGTDSCAVRALHWRVGTPDGLANDRFFYSYGDALGNLQLELDQQGDIVSREEYYPYGGTAVWAARSQTEVAYKTRRYSGKERDVTGLYFYGYRYYQPWSARWLSADPAGNAAGLNLYCMVTNNPVSLRDRHGLMPLRSLLDRNHVGTMQLNDRTVEVRKSPWQNALQIGKEPRVTFQSALVTVNKGNVAFSRAGDTAAFSDLYKRWEQGDISLIRGISSNHFSWNEIVADGIARSEGDVDAPMATMSGGKTRWLPTALDDESNRFMVAGISQGNHLPVLRDAMRDEAQGENVIAGAILKFTAGKNHPLNINYLYDGEIVVQGPVEIPAFKIDAVITGNLLAPVDVSALDVDDYGLLPLAAPFLPSYEQASADAQSLAQELAQHFLAKSSYALTQLRTRLAERR